MTLAITGATGQLGRLAIAALKARGLEEPIVALARDPAKAADLGVEVRRADYREPESLAAALQSIDRLVLISASEFDDRAGQHRNVIEAAKAAGVKHLVYTSILKGLDSPALIAEDHKATEKEIAASGIPATILRNGWYTENYTGSLDGALAAGAMIGSAGDGKLSTAARADYAEAIAVVLTEPGHVGKIYELAGDTAYTHAEMAAEVSKIAGKAIPYNDLPEAEYRGVLESFGLPGPVAAILADADARAGDRGSLFDDSRTLSGLIGRPTTPMAETVAAALAG